jgi:hypothetical protein
VKGGYWDSEIKRAQVDGLEGYPVYTRKIYTDISYVACAKSPRLDPTDGSGPCCDSLSSGSLRATPMSTPVFFRSRLDAMIDLRHPLAVLATRIPWASIESALAPVFERRAREGRLSEDVDLFGVVPAPAGVGVSSAGRPRLPSRLMVGLLYLKHA